MTNPAGHLTLSHELVGQKNDEAKILFKGAAEFLGWTGTGPVIEGTIDNTTLEPSPRGTSFGMVLAREFGEDAIYAKLRAHAEENYEPMWDGPSGEFTWGFGLNEPYPRGQLNGPMATAEAISRNSMWGIYNKPNLRKFIEPTVYGVDFPNICLTQASYDADQSVLVIATDQGLPSVSGQPTSFRITNVNPHAFSLKVDGELSEQWEIVNGDIEVSTTIGEHTFLINL